MPEGCLYVCATPIGNLGDVSDRLRETLVTADVIYAEDTRRTSKLLQHIGAKTKARSLFVGNEKARSRKLVDEVRAGKTVVLVSDAGMPTVSDPGAEAVRIVQDEGLSLTVIPGPSAVTTAITLSGFGGDRFSFEGFLPRKGKERSRRLHQLGFEDRPVVMFASPHRLAGDLRDLLDVVGVDRKVAVTREMTKLHEEVWVGTLGEAVERWTGEIKGEITLVLEGGSLTPVTAEAAIAEARSLVDAGNSPSDAARSVAQDSGVSRRVIYQALLEGQDVS
ncbi:MAG: 16S rRNA (cytidine(1402)-2'-O)-methyltransferase [Actinobacteria bacterium]|nr:16S rRNA (cytidine(1402)-2'-O)-methyltransferase [Actinomycetota bacterium]MCZ6630293.1 16S rRNA (cytidine(1402)-2'-O)-methyltransferase [Actinomycetota bacterium]MCZ6737894.1 16S rRNA (cytidine(1402)-2'-O)-methyltransferase [Actinomycetota bacterium]